MPVMFSTETNSRFVAMYAGLNSLVLDYVAKLKVAGVHLTYVPKAVSGLATSFVQQRRNSLHYPASP
jgi:hypothetical protein